MHLNIISYMQKLGNDALMCLDSVVGNVIASHGAKTLQGKEDHIGLSVCISMSEHTQYKNSQM